MIRFSKPRVAFALASAGVRQVDLATTIGVPGSSLNSILSGRVAVDDDLAARIAAQLDATIDVLVDPHAPAEQGCECRVYRGRRARS